MPIEISLRGHENAREALRLYPDLVVKKLGMAMKPLGKTLVAQAKTNLVPFQKKQWAINSQIKSSVRSPKKDGELTGKVFLKFGFKKEFYYGWKIDFGNTGKRRAVKTGQKVKKYSKKWKKWIVTDVKTYGALRAARLFMRPAIEVNESEIKRVAHEAIEEAIKETQHALNNASHGID